jgi:hypothetical protein
MPLLGEQVWRRWARDTLERDGSSLEGALGSRSRQDLARGGVQPPSEAEPLPWGRPALERGGTSPEGRPAFEGGGTSPERATGPRARRSCTGTAPYPSSGAEFRPRVARPIVWWAVGLWVCFARVLYECKRVFPGYLGDPHGCPRQNLRQQHKRNHLAN